MKLIEKIGFLAALMAFLLVFRSAMAVVPEQRNSLKRPNVIFILVDDQGYYDLNCYSGDEFETPNIDRMASEGVRLTDYYAAAPICSPSRAGILTGCYPRRVGMATWVHRADSRLGIHPDELTIAELFKAHGYATACIGKWHLGFQTPFLPRSQGFDHYYGLLHNLDKVEVVHLEAEGGVPLIRNGEVIKRPADEAELTKLYTDETIDFVRKNKDDPFFIYLPHTMLHNPLGAGKAFQGKSKMGMYGDAIMEMDFNVGRILNTLKALNLDDNTIVVYTSDNGRGPGRKPSQPIQGRKLSTWEGGIRVPAIIRGIGIRQGYVTDQVINAMDWFPTLATMAGIKVPKGRVIDGRDVSSLFKGETDVVLTARENKALNGQVPLRRNWRPASEWAPIISREEYERAFFYHGSQGALAAVRLDEWKLYLNPQLTLYNLKKDPGERKPLRGSMIRKLRGMAVMFQEEMLLDARKVGYVPKNAAKQKAKSRREPQTQSKGQSQTVSLQKPKQAALKTTRLSPDLIQSLKAYRDVTYVSYGDRRLEMDIYRPKEFTGKLPAIVCIHGGGWAKGNRKSHGRIAMALAARGFVGATISYRLSGEKPFPAQIHDCKAAVRFLRENSEKYGINASKMGAIGLSAGGHLTALLATSGGVQSLEGKVGVKPMASSIQAAVPMGAQTNLESDRTRSVSASQGKGRIWQQFLSGSQAENFKTYQQASPRFHLDSQDPPIMMITGENDDPSTHADQLRARMKEMNIATGLTIIPGAPHGFIGKQVWFDQAIEKAATFFQKHLKG